MHEEKTAKAQKSSKASKSSKTPKSSIRKSNKKKKQGFLYLYLFAFVFLVALAGFSYLVKSYSPDIDVAIGNNDSITLSDEDMDVEIKSVDERLKWIQMEDEMPTVALRNSERQENPLSIDFYSLSEENIEPELRVQESKKKVITPPTPSIKDIQSSRPDFRTVVSNVAPNNFISKGPIPLPSKPESSVPLPTTTITKVYLGAFTSLEDAMATQQEISSRDKTMMPFIKANNGTYIVQVGSFSDKNKAIALVQKLREIGYSPKVTSSN